MANSSLNGVAKIGGNEVDFQKMQRLFFIVPL